MKRFYTSLCLMLAILLASAQTQTSHYRYDANGNLIENTQKGLVFKYNRLNLLSEVWQNGELKLRYTYLADGTKLGVRTADGLNGYDYNGSFVYKVTNGQRALEAALTADAQLTPEEILYTLTDHVGSVRALVDEQGKVVEQNDYYPLGLKQEKPEYAQKGNRFLFSGQEQQQLLDKGIYDFGARMYDASLGRWTSVDPMAESSTSWSPYTYCFGNPVRLIDVGGCFATDYFDQYGNLLAHTNDGFDRSVIVPEDQESYFLQNYNASKHFSISKSAGWNNHWAETFDGTPSYISQLTPAQLDVLNNIDTAWGRKLAIKHWLNPDAGLGSMAKVYAAIAFGQYTNPELVLGGATMLAGKVPTVTKSVQGFRSFAAFKRVHGAAGPGMAWHHIVEQTPANIAKFGGERLHNLHNVIKLPHGKGSIHSNISGHYSSKPKHLKGKTVREWLSTQSFQKQYEYGIKKLKDYGWKP